MGEINKTKRSVAKIKEIHSLENKTMIKVIELTHNSRGMRGHGQKNL